MPSPLADEWVALAKTTGTPAYLAAFTRDAVLEASVLETALVGPEAIGHFFREAAAMYDSLGFTHEARAGTKTYFEWSGRVFGSEVGGATVVTRTGNGLIEHVRLLHCPLPIVTRFSAELARRLQVSTRPPSAAR